MLRHRHSEPDPEPSGFGNQIGSDQEDPRSHRPQPPLKPARGEHGLSKAPEQVVAHAAGSEHGIGGVKRLQTDGVQTPVLFEPREPIRTVCPVRVHARDQFCGNGHTGDEDAVRITWTLDPPLAGGRSISN